MAEFNPAWLERVPAPPPDRRVDDPGYRDGTGRLRERGQPELEATWYWTTRLEAALPRIADDLRAVRYTARVAAGFIPEMDGAFGVIVHTEPPQELPADEPFDRPLPGEPIATIGVDGQDFPVVVREAVVERHWCTAPEVTSPTQARATCWVRSPTRGYEGWLLPRHAVDPLNAPVSFGDGSTGQVVDHFGECIDSVVVSSNNSQRGLTLTRACWPVTAGQGLLITDAPGSHLPVTVMDTDMSLGVVSNVVFPIRVSTDWTGVPGQSGALLVEPNLGEPAGSYLGVLRPTLRGYLLPGMTAVPASTGYAQACHQLETATGMEFYV